MTLNHGTTPRRHGQISSAPIWWKAARRASAAGRTLIRNAPHPPTTNFGCSNFPAHKRGVIAFFAVEMKQKGEKRAIESERAGRPADDEPGTPGGAISRGRAPDTPELDHEPKVPADQIICFYIYGARTAAGSTPNCFAPCRF